MDLDPPQWEVGLSEIQFPHLWYNVREGRNVLIKEIYQPTVDELNRLYPIDKNKNEMEEYEKRRKLLESQPERTLLKYRQELKVPFGYYKKPIQLITRLMEFEHGAIRPIKYDYDEISRKVTLTLPQDCMLDFNNTDVAQCLGISPNKKVTSNHSADQVSSMNKYNSIYVYTDIIQNQTTGDVKAPLLRVVPVTSKYGTVSCIHYDRPHYLPLNRKDIHTVEIHLRDDQGELISFESGKVVVTLVFRRKQVKFYT